MQCFHAIDHVVVRTYLPCDIELVHSHSYHIHSQDRVCILLIPSDHSCTDPYMKLLGTRLKITKKNNKKPLLIILMLYNLYIMCIIYTSAKSGENQNLSFH